MVDKDFSKVYSYSKIKRFEKCPLEYYFFYLHPEWKGFQRPKDYNTKGSAIHNALTLFYHLESDQRSLDNLKKCLNDSWFADLDPKKKPPLGQIAGFKDIEHERKVYWDAMKMLEKFFELGDINPLLFYLPSKNIRYSFSDYEQMVKPINEEFFVSGKFDRIDKLEDGRLRIIDFKTGRDNQDKFQLDFYRILAEMNFDESIGVVSFYYLKNGKVKDFPVFESRSNEIKEQILEKLNKIKTAKEFVPKPSRLCDFCDFKQVCPVFQ